jgi:hypothetical protein
MGTTEDLKQARALLKNKEWPQAREVLRKMYPASTNSKFIGDLLKAAAVAQRTNDTELLEQLVWLAVEIYESGRDENSEVLTGIRMLADVYNKSGRSHELQILSGRTFMLVLISSEGLLRSVKSLTKQLHDVERSR